MLDEAAITAGEVMTRDVAVVHPESTLLEAVRLMSRRGISGLPVVDAHGAVVGMLTEGDLLRWHEGYSDRQTRWLDMLAEGTQLTTMFLEAIQAEHRKVKSVMSSSVTTVTESTSAREIARLMHAQSIKRIPVLRDGNLVGIVARSDLVRALAEELAEPPRKDEIPLETINESLRRRLDEKS
jgi:CBS domain-containing protein